MRGWEKVDAAEAWMPSDTCERCGKDCTEGEVLLLETEDEDFTACSKECAEWVEETLDPEV